VVSKNIITWQPFLTDHQAYTYEALQIASNRELFAFITKTENSVRKSQGWTETKVSSIKRILIPNKIFFSFCFKELFRHKNDIHIFASPFEDPRLIVFLFITRILGLKFYLISEPYSPIREGYLGDASSYLNMIKMRLRPLLYRFYSLFLRGGVLGIFAISKLAYDQYLDHGIPKEKLFQFGYFIPRNKQLSNLMKSPLKNSHPFKIVYVGALIRRKGLDVLQEAICYMQKSGYQVSLDIYGAGDKDLIISDFDFISYRGLIPFGDAQQVISHYDLLILPSRYDGWGVVINEALCANVPVVCADSVGAGEVAKNFGAGLSFSRGNSISLASVIMGLMDDHNLLNSLRNNTSFAADALQPEVAARFILEVMNSSKQISMDVKSPWYF
jgi:glycosyltransferase involved in cell wall biosynthesis